MRIDTPASSHTDRRSAGRCIAALAALVCAGPCLAQDAGKPTTGIYTCTDNQGRRLTADRPIPECASKEQKVLNADGSLKAIHPPSLTADERAEREARERRLAEERAAIADAGRRDRNLIKRYPNEAAHQRAREVALDTVRMAIRASELRLRELASERRPLMSEAEFYQGRGLPPKLKQQLDANDASAEAQRSASANQEAELGRVTRLFDAELERLRRLWAGAAPGSLGPIQMPQGPVAAPASAPARKATLN
jgi:hypothetical protein